jgi:RecA/RadA recombinase
MAKKQTVKKPMGLQEALAFLGGQQERQMFTPTPRRYIPMRHKQLATVLGGPDHPGIPTGVYIEIRGAEHSGKTTTTFAMVEAVINQSPDAEHLRVGPKGLESVPCPRRVLFLDFEHALDLTYMMNAIPGAVMAQFDNKGVITNPDEANLFVHQPKNIEEGGDILRTLVETGEFGMVVIDSIAAAVGMEEQEKGMTENTVGLQARAMGKLFRKNTSTISDYGCTVVMVNQLRDKIGVAFGSPEFAPGGRAKDFYDSIVLRVSGKRQNPWFEDGKEVKVRATKNKATGELDQCLYYCGGSIGLSAEVELTEVALECGVIGNKRHASPVYLLPEDMNAKAVKCKRKFDNMTEWLAALRASPKLFHTVWAKCVATGGVDMYTGETSDVDDDGIPSGGKERKRLL